MFHTVSARRKIDPCVPPTLESATDVGGSRIHMSKCARTFTHATHEHLYRHMCTHVKWKTLETNRHMCGCQINAHKE